MTAPIIKALKSFTSDYTFRHRNAANVLLHIIGIPLVIFGIILFFKGNFTSGLFYFISGYLFQWIGHRAFQKNELGEWVLIKKAIKKIAKR